MCSWYVLRPCRRDNPLVHSSLVDGDERGRKARICKGPDRDHHKRFQSLRFVVDGGAALRAEMKRDPRTFIAYADVFSRGTRDRCILPREPRLLTEGATGSALAGQTVADGDAHWLADNLNREQTTTARGETSGQMRSPGHLTIELSRGGRGAQRRDRRRLERLVGPRSAHDSGSPVKRFRPFQKGHAGHDCPSG